MKKLTFSFFIAFIAIANIFAQAPQAINYQAVVRDTNGTVISNQNISLRISILSDSIAGTIVYIETHNAITNSLGLVNIAIGRGQVESGDFLTIDWGSSSHFMRTEADVTGGSNYLLLGISQLLSVPYALNASSLVLTSPNRVSFEVTIDDNGNIITTCFPQPIQSDAGPDSLGIAGDSIALMGNTAVNDQGLWTIFGGYGGSFADSTNPTTMFYALPGYTYNLVWTISNNCGSSSDTVIISFASLCGKPFVDARDGQTYNTVQIGNQCWMVENLAYLPSVNFSYLNSHTTPYYYVYDYFGTDVSAAKATSNYQTYGVLYNWPAAMDSSSSSNSVPSGVQGICPAGWYLPGDEEWKILEGEVDSLYGYPNSEWNGTGWRGSDAGGNLKETGTTHWYLPNTGATNIRGFTALPGGIRSSNGSFIDMGHIGTFWLSTEDSSFEAWGRYLSFNSASVYRYYLYKADGYSVRCCKDN